ncbi:MAG TPA: Ppx/GppA family phosphatase, partial [Stellaceae bacterium]|nr:Ppx/GppA family phosphatase [Stellaceae bacterium]
MFDLDPLAAAERIGVIDLGSNSLRLVVFERLGAAVFPLFNEKVMCGLGRGIASTGRLNPEGVALALVNLRRFVAFARAIAVDHLAVLATAAVRDAVNGVEFTETVRKRWRVPVRILSGSEEARLSALGVVSGIPDADGLMGDLGGGSVELVGLDHGRLGPHVTLPLGPLRV